MGSSVWSFAGCTLHPGRAWGSKKFHCRGKGEPELPNWPEGNGENGTGAAFQSLCSFPRHCCPPSSLGSPGSFSFNPSVPQRSALPLLAQTHGGVSAGFAVIFLSLLINSFSKQHMPAPPAASHLLQQLAHLNIGRWIQGKHLCSRTGLLEQEGESEGSCSPGCCSWILSPLPKPSGFQGKVSSVFLMASAQSGYPCRLLGAAVVGMDCAVKSRASISGLKSVLTWTTIS